MATLIDVSRKANVSPSTVSRYIRNPKTVAGSKRSIIEKVIQELGYVPNLNASSLKSRSSNLVGIILPSNYNAFFSSLVWRMNDSLKRINKQLLVLYAQDFNEVKANIATLLSLCASSVIFIPERKSHTIKTITMSNSCYPLQLFVDNFPQFDSLTIDDKKGAYLATQKLLENGHRRILMIDYQNDVFIKRLDGYKQAMSDVGAEFLDDGILALNSPDGCDQLIKQAIEKFKPTAVLCVTESLSQRFCMLIQNMNLSIPEDISFVVYDDSPWAELCGYSAISQPMDSFIENILFFVNSNTRQSGNSVKYPTKLIFEPILVERKSIKNMESGGQKVL